MSIIKNLNSIPPCTDLQWSEILIARDICYEPSKISLMQYRNRESRRRAQRLDTEWFQAHPGRAYRLRRPAPGELPELPQAQTYVAVHRLRAGVYIRHHCTDYGTFPEADAPENAAKYMFQWSPDFTFSGAKFFAEKDKLHNT